jgi:hypothetical protein
MKTLTTMSKAISPWSVLIAIERLKSVVDLTESLMRGKLPFIVMIGSG